MYVCIYIYIHYTYIYIYAYNIPTKISMIFGASVTITRVQTCRGDKHTTNTQAHTHLHTPTHSAPTHLHAKASQFR